MIHRDLVRLKRTTHTMSEYTVCCECGAEGASCCVGLLLLQQSGLVLCDSAIWSFNILQLLIFMMELREISAWYTCWLWSFVVDKFVKDGTLVSKHVEVGVFCNLFYCILISISCWFKIQNICVLQCTVPHRATLQQTYTPSLFTYIKIITFHIYTHVRIFLLTFPHFVANKYPFPLRIIKFRYIPVVARFDTVFRAAIRRLALCISVH